MNEPQFILLTVLSLISVGWLLALTSCSPKGVGVPSQIQIYESSQARLRHKLYQALTKPAGRPAAKMGARRPVDTSASALHPPTRDLALIKSFRSPFR